jgi:hypothetical protein
MIKNEKQYAITKKKLKNFQDALELIASSNEDHNSLGYRLKFDSINSQMEDFKNEIAEYEKLKSGEYILNFDNIENINIGIIKARIIKGYNHKKMAELLGTSEQQIHLNQILMSVKKNTGF